MVVLKDLSREFLRTLSNQRVLVFIVCDVDGLCCWNILRHLFRCHQISFTFIPISSKTDLIEKFKAYSNDRKYSLLINCGANIDIVEFLQVPDDLDKVFFICDSHRPIHVNNYYNQVQVKLITMKEDFSSLPAYDDLFAEFSEDEEEGIADDDDDEEIIQPKRKKSRLNADIVQKRIRKREFLKKKEEILMEYESFSYHASSSAVLLFDLAWKLSHDTMTLLWNAIVGHTSLLFHHRHNREHYLAGVDYLQDQVVRMSRNSNSTVPAHNNNNYINEQDMEDSPTNELLKINFQEDMTLWLYRHWSLLEALDNTMPIVCRFRLFTLDGKKKRDELMAQIGIAKRESNQRYGSMKPELKNLLVNSFMKQGELIGLHRRDFMIPTFTVQEGFHDDYSALDAVIIASAVLECSGSCDVVTNFQKAGDCLSFKSPSISQWSMNIAQQQLKHFTSQVENLIGSDMILSYGPFLYCVVPNTSLVASYLSMPLCQQILAKYCLLAKVSKSRRNRRMEQMPLVFCIEFEETSLMRLLGVPPVHGDDDRNLFGQAFDTAAKTTQSRLNSTSFDDHIVELNSTDIFKFFDSLSSLLA